MLNVQNSFLIVEVKTVHFFTYNRVVVTTRIVTTALQYSRLSHALHLSAYTGTIWIKMLCITWLKHTPSLLILRLHYRQFLCYTGNIKQHRTTLLSCNVDEAAEPKR